MSDVTRWWFQPRRDTANVLAQKVMAASHRNVVIRDGLVGLVPFEYSTDTGAQKERMETHFNAIYVGTHE